MSRPPARRPQWNARVRADPVVDCHLPWEDAWCALGAIHDARRVLKALASHPELVRALEAHERALGLCLGPLRARRWLQAREPLGPQGNSPETPATRPLAPSEKSGESLTEGAGARAAAPSREDSS
ncbi:MAG: hypothetical protein HY909_08290 [Deltaproteobacteria bacterium]|nr:hypothetical protein [Deltaproteobacteria bacterium]